MRSLIGETMAALPKSISVASAKELGNVLCEGVRDIDKRCVRKFNGIDGGLCNVKLQFREQALSELGKRLTEETLISWLLMKHLAQKGFVVELERPYPAGGRCDLVLSNPVVAWIEVKLAWKQWFKCDGGTGCSPAYKGYLFGDN